LISAIIDLGTNTFNLLIVEHFGNKFKTVHKDRIPVKLGKGGITEKKITSEAFERGINALAKYKTTISDFKAVKTYAFATSAIRSATNGNDFIQKVYDQLNIKIEIINGDKEAELIYYGVKEAVPLSTKIVLIMDIGGGSTEFIIANENEIFWKKSYELGVTRLKEIHDPSDPINKAEIAKLEQYISDEILSLHDALKNYKCSNLIGASGSFESIAKMIEQRKNTVIQDKGKPYTHILLSDFHSIHNDLIKSKFEERMQMKGLVDFRVETIVIASIFINLIINQFSINQLQLSKFALREGVLFNEVLKSK